MESDGDFNLKRFFLKFQNSVLKEKKEKIIGQEEKKCLLLSLENDLSSPKKIMGKTKLNFVLLLFFSSVIK